MALPPCHWGWGVCVYGDELNLSWVQRSCDLLLGVPSNIASYALLLTLLAKVAGLKPGNLTGLLVDCHIYENQIDMSNELLWRSPKNLPSIEIVNNDNFDIFQWEANHAQLFGYDPHPATRVEVVV